MTNEDKALEKYPVGMGSDIGFWRSDANAEKRQAYLEGLKDNTKAIEVLERLKDVKPDLSLIKEPYPLEEHKELEEIVLIAANTWKIQSVRDWSKLLYEINVLCLKLKAKEDFIEQEMQKLK